MRIVPNVQNSFDFAAYLKRCVIMEKLISQGTNLDILKNLYSASPSKVLFEDENEF